MSEKKVKVSDFASLVGCSQKTIYKLIENNQLKTVNEIQNGRSITLVVTNNEQIEELLKIYGKLPVNEGKCEELLTDNESQDVVNISQNVDIFEKMMSLNEQFNNQLMTYNEKLLSVNEELMTYKSKIPLLEDKASREGLYLQEIKDLKTTNKKLIVGLITVTIILIVGLFTVIVFLSLNAQKSSNDAVIDRQLPVNEVVNEVKQVKK